MRKKEVLFPLILFLLALSLRMAALGGKSLWGDEFYAAGLMNSSLGNLITSSFKGSPHPPLAFFGLKISTLVFGTSEAGLRAIPALLTSLAVLPLYFFTKSRSSGMSAFSAGILWAFSPYAVSLGQEAWIYGILAFTGFTFIWLADLTWKGNRTASFFLVPAGLAGMLVQHLFFLFLAAGFLLYFSLEKQKRVPLKNFFVLGFIMTVVYLPFVFPALQQAGLRTERLSNATTPDVILHRLLFRTPTVIARLIPGGIAGEFSLWSLSSPVTPVIFLLSFLSAFIPVILYLAKRSAHIRMRLWAGSLFFIPLLLFLGEDPTVRHLSIMWIPLSLSMAALSRSFKPAALTIVLFTALLLVPYYRLDSYPYHRSNWREAVAYTEEQITGAQQVVVLAGQNGGLAWDYYSVNNFSRLAPGGENPYEVQATRSAFDPASVIDSVLASESEVWVVHDIWGGPCAGELAPGWPVVSRELFGPHLEVVHFGIR